MTTPLVALLIPARPGRARRGKLSQVCRADTKVRQVRISRYRSDALDPDTGITTRKAVGLFRLGPESLGVTCAGSYILGL